MSGRPIKRTLRGQRLVEPFPHARGRTRVVSVHAPRQVLQQTLGRLDVAVRVGAREDRVGLEFRIRSLNRGLGHHCVAPEF